MLYAFGFDRVGVLVSDLYFVNPDPEVGQEGAERGVRLEVRLLERGELKGSIYSAQPILVGRPVYRADLLEAVASPPGSLDRAHDHPWFRGWEPGARHFDPDLAAAPLDYVATKLADLDALLVGAELSAADAGPADAPALRAAVPEIVDTVRRLLERVKAGDLGRGPAGPGGGELISARVGWL